MGRGLLALALGARRIAAALREMTKQMRRMADALEMQGGRGVGLRSFYGDLRPGAVDEARLFEQSDEDFAELERTELARKQAGREPGLEESLDLPDEGWR
jgi:inactivated superfamily I helicase